MAHRVAPPARDADNTVGNARIAALSDWRRVDADSMSARDSKIPLQMPDIRLQALSQHAIKPDRLSYLREESIYALLGAMPLLTGFALHVSKLTSPTQSQ